MRRRICQFLALRPADRRLFVGAWLALPAIDCSLRLVGFQRTQRLLARLASFPRTPSLTQAQVTSTAARAAAVIAISGRYAILDGTCLRQTLLLWHLLRRSGLSPEIQFGVSKENGFSAHAWVKLGGRHLNQTRGIEARFAPLEREPQHPRLG